MEKKDFLNCQACGTTLGKIEYDSPIFCEACITEMFNRSLTPTQYSKTIKR